VKVILDANCAMEIAFNKSDAGRLKALLAESEQVLAPDLIVPEFVNGLWKLYQFTETSLGLCDQALGTLLEMIDTFVPSREIYRDAFAISRAQKTRAAVVNTYDMFYLALALRENATLLTLDGTLKKEARRAGVRVG
jgi:predicted nucleic acid-binding protein